MQAQFHDLERALPQVARRGEDRLTHRHLPAHGGPLVLEDGRGEGRSPDVGQGGLPVVGRVLQHAVGVEKDSSRG